MAPVGNGFQPTASIAMEPSGITAQSNQIAPGFCRRQHLVRRFSARITQQATTTGFGDGFTGMPHGQLRDGACTQDQRKTFGHGGRVHHYHRITAEFVPRPP
ncbi:ribose-phosphate pyrophosphokinase [Synechococcus sp. BL107]|nr:ribose-phosphate pyrophosphokinase [Synechococcus sp. BL107]